jgi:activator of HSP90 ATPase
MFQLDKIWILFYNPDNSYPIYSKECCMSETIHQTVIFKAPPHEVYEALMDETIHAQFTGSTARIGRAVGETFNAYDGYITGKNIELVPDQKIVQEWRAVDWEPGQISLITFAFSPVPEGTRLDFTHDGLPEGTEDEFAQGWIDNYWGPMHRMFAG